MSKYDEESFWAGVALGQQLKGWSAFGIIDGFDPDGGLIVRPIQQGIPMIKFARDTAFTVCNMTDTVDYVTDSLESLEPQDNISAIVFQRDMEFAIVPLSDSIETDEAVMYYIVSKAVNQPSYDKNFVKEVYNGFTMITSSTEYSTEEAIDSGHLQALRVDTDRFESITNQEVT